MSDNHDQIPPTADMERLLGAAESSFERVSASLSKELLDLLHRAVELGASDLHLVPGYPPTYRVNGDLRPSEAASLEPEQVRQMVASILADRARFKIDEAQDFDSSLGVTHNGVMCRFRANVFLSQGSWCVCLRNIPDQIPSLAWLGFPEPLAQRLVSLANGLVIVTGVTGSGKSATLAALVALLREGAHRRILTVEEPIEYLHNPGSGGIVTQREVGRDVESFADGLKFGLRQDPDVILVGEIRDRETAQMALSAAETGHLILTSLHTRDAKGAVSRLVDIFPQDVQEDMRKQIAMSLRAVVCQHLLPSADADEKRVLALEVLLANYAVQVAIRTGKLEQIESAIQTGKRDGMVALDEDLQRLVREGRITGDVARGLAKDPAHIHGGGGAQRAATVLTM